MVGTVLELRNLSKIYQMGSVEVPALKGINLCIKEGEFVAVVGASGSGKSTVLNMMGALDSPTKGSVLLDGIDLTRLPESEIARVRGRKIGFIFQVFNLYPTLNVFENIALPMCIHEFSENEIKERVNKLVNDVGLGDRATHLPSELSGGQRQRVAVARSLSAYPSLVLADEPTGNLDTKTSKEIIDILCRLHREEGKTIILVTHETDIAENAERIITLKDGEIFSDKQTKVVKKS